MGARSSQPTAGRRDGETASAQPTAGRRDGETAGRPAQAPVASSAVAPERSLALDAVRRWFTEQGWAPFDFQEETWRRYLAGEDGLIHAATGTGKTYAAWMGPVAEALAERAAAGAAVAAPDPSAASGRAVAPPRHPEDAPRAVAAPHAAATSGRAVAPPRHQEDAVKASAAREPAAPGNPAVPPSRRPAVRRTRPRALARDRAAPLTVLWITPLRALATDLVGALRAPLQALGLESWIVEARTGDTSGNLKAKQRDRPPTALVTTPESLSLLLSYPDARERLSTLRCVVVDEWHELMGSKRGAQLELALARLRAWNPALRTWGLSATLGNLEEAARTLVGPGRLDCGTATAGAGAGGATPTLISGEVPKPYVVDTLVPAEISRFPWAGHLGLRLLPEVLDAIEGAHSTLLFTNVRSQAEAWYQAIVTFRPDWVDTVALHHGSIDRKLRQQVEEGLRQGKLRCVVCTSSLDLGVDFTPVDQVIQIGSPKGIARLLQRAGRSGHRPGEASRVLCVPTHAFELVEFAAARDAMERRAVEPRPGLDRPLDVLVQHLVTVALAGGFHEQELLREVRTTTAFQHLSEHEWRWALDFVTRGGPALRAYPQFQRLVERDGYFNVASLRIARMHRLSIGTITGDPVMQLQYLRGRKLGTIEESFIARLRPGDRFVFAGKVLKLVRIKDMTAFVRIAPGAKGEYPRWNGARLSFSTMLGEAVKRKIAESSAADAPDDGETAGQPDGGMAGGGPAAGALTDGGTAGQRDGGTTQRRHREDSGGDAVRAVSPSRSLAVAEPAPEMMAVAPLLALQQRWSALPRPGALLLELSRSRDGYHAYLFPFEGRPVHEGLSALLAYRLAQEAPRSITVTSNDYGFELLSAQPLPADAESWRRLFSADRLVEDLLASLNAAELDRRQFREIARVAGLVFPGYPGMPRAARQLQASSGLLYDVFVRYDPDNLLLDQARREVLERQLEVARIRQALERMASQELLLVTTARLTPLAFPLWADRIQAAHVTTEKWTDRVRRMAGVLEKAAGAARTRRGAQERRGAERVRARTAAGEQAGRRGRNRPAERASSPAVADAASPAREPEDTASPPSRRRALPLSPDRRPDAEPTTRGRAE